MDRTGSVDIYGRHGRSWQGTIYYQESNDVIRRAKVRIWLAMPAIADISPDLANHLDLTVVVWVNYITYEVWGVRVDWNWEVELY